MANLTDKNIKTLSQIETIDASEEQNAFFLCGKGERLKKINFDRLRRKVNGTILPTKKPDNTKLGELWLEGTKIEDKAEREKMLLAKNKDYETPYVFENFVRVDENTYFLRDKIPFKKHIEVQGTTTYISYQPIFSDGATFDFIVFTKDLIVFFNKSDVTLSRAIVRDTLKEISINENFVGSISFETLQLVNATYPMENANGVLFDDSDNMTFRFYSFDLLADGETFGYSEITSLDYSELGTVNGAKAVVKANVTNSENEILILPKVDGVYCYGDQVICDHEIKLSFIRDFGEGEKTLFIFVGENQASVYNEITKEIETLSLFSDSTTLAEVVSGAETLNGLYLLQKTTTENIFSIVKYSVDDNNEKAIEKLREWNSKQNGQGENILVDFVSFLIDTKQATLQLDGEKPEPNFYFISTKRQYADNSHGLYTNYVDEILSSIYEYKMMLAYGESYQEIQGYKGEQGEVSTKKLNETVNNAIARVVADAPEDFDTLKEMSDWIAEHQDDATAMNTAIAENKTAIEENKTAIESLNTKVYASDYSRVMPCGEYVRFEFFSKSMQNNGIFCLEMTGKITGGASLSLNMRFCGGSGYTGEFGVSYDYIGQGGGDIEIYPIIVGDTSGSVALFRSFGLTMKNLTTDANTKIIITSLKLNGEYCNPNDYVQILTTKPSRMHENGKITPSTINGVILLNETK